MNTIVREYDYIYTHTHTHTHTLSLFSLVSTPNSTIDLQSCVIFHDVFGFQYYGEMPD